MRIILPALTALLVLATPESAVAQHQHDPTHHPRGDSAFQAMQARGKTAMGVDQYRSTHRFTPLPEGGRIELTSDSADTAAAMAIRSHFRSIARAFAAGDFSTPGFVHRRDVPGTAVMKARASRISYQMREVPRGAELLIRTRDAESLAAIHEFLAFQMAEHHSGPPER